MQNLSYCTQLQSITNEALFYLVKNHYFTEGDSQKPENAIKITDKKPPFEFRDTESWANHILRLARKCDPQRLDIICRPFSESKRLRYLSLTNVYDRLLWLCYYAPNTFISLTKELNETNRDFNIHNSKWSFVLSFDRVWELVTERKPLQRDAEVFLDDTFSELLGLCLIQDNSVLSVPSTGKSNTVNWMLN